MAANAYEHELSDPVAAFRELAAVLTEIKHALGTETLVEQPVVDPLAEARAARVEIPSVPFVVSIVPEQDAAPLEPVEPEPLFADLVPRRRHRFLGRPVH